MAKIWILDDDPSLGQLLSAFIEREGYLVEHFERPSQLPQDKFPALLILDGMLPEKDGLQVLVEIKGKTNPPPILMLSARADVESRIEGLKTGADDYLAKPFEPRELMARIEALLRLKNAAASTHPTQRRLYSINPERREFKIKEVLLDLSALEFDLLSALCAVPFKVFSRESLMEQAQGIQVEIFSRSIDIAISRLRQKMKPHEAEFWIKTIRGVGYQFCPPEVL